MNWISKAMIMAGVICGVVAGRAQNTAQPTVFVAPLDGDVNAILAWNPALGEGLAEMLITELTRINRFQVVESTSLKDLANEINLGESGFVSKEERVEKGGWAGADFMFKGKVTRFGNNEKNVDLGGFVPRNFGGLGVKLTTADVRIDWRFVDVATRKIIKTGSAIAQQKGGGFDVGVNIGGRGGRIGFDNHEFMNSALGKATAKAVTNIVTELQTITLPESGRMKQKAQEVARQQQAANDAQAQANAAADALKKTPGKVLAVVNASTVIVSLGAQHGFKAGDRLNLYEAIETKDEKGQVVFTEEKLIGEVSLETVQGDRSKAHYSGSVPIKAGWVVKIN